MRPIICRGKRKDNGEWVEGYYHKIDNYDDYKKAYIIPKYASTLYSFEVDPETVGQYIGSKDKNEKEIYEDDIMDDDQEPMKVVYQDGSYGLNFLNNEQYFDNCINWDTCEIIGNIHDHLHLLGGESK